MAIAIDLNRFRAHTLNEPAKIHGMTIVVVVQCQQCEAGEQLALVNAQPAVCPSCGATYSADRVLWEKTTPSPQIALSATPPRNRAFT